MDNEFRDSPDEDLLTALGLEAGALLRGVLGMRQGTWEPPGLEELAGAVEDVEFLGLAARGGMGAVYRARQLSLGREVAVKLLPPEWRHSGGRAARFEREGRLLGKLQHAHVVTLHGFGRTVEGWPFLMMEFVAGGTLQDRLRDRAKGPVAWEEACRWVVEIAGAVAAAHALGIEHRDLKPANVLLADGALVKVADFGLAGLCGEGGGERVGSRYYSAPEQLTGDGADGRRADVYSLGVMAAELLTGRRAGEGEHWEEVPGEGVPEPYTKVVQRAASPEAARRQADAGVFLEEWHAARRAQELERKARENRRKLRRTRWLAAVLMLLVLAAGWFGWQAWIQQQRAIAAQGQAEEARENEKAAKREALRLAVASDMVTAQEMLERSGPEAAMPWVARVLRTDPVHFSAGWMAGQFLLEKNAVNQVASVKVPDAGNLDSSRSVDRRRGVAWIVTDGGRHLLRCKASGAAPFLQVAPWPEQAPLTGCETSALSADGSRLVVSLQDGSLRMLDATTGAMIWELAAPPAGAKSGAQHVAAISTSGRLVLQSAATFEGRGGSSRLRVVQADTGKAAGEAILFPCAVDARHVAVSADDRWLIAGCGQDVWLSCTDLRTGQTQELTHLWKQGDKAAGAVFPVCLVPGTTRVLAGGQGLGHRVVCVDYVAGEVVWDVQVLGGRATYTKAVYFLAMAPDGIHFLATGTEGQARLYKVSDGSAAGPPLRQEGTAIIPFFEGDDMLVLGGPETTSLWRWKTGERIASVRAPQLIPFGTGRLMGLNQERLTLWRINGPAARMAEYSCGTGKACFDLDAGGRVLLAAAGEGRVRVVDLETFEEYAVEARHAAGGETTVRRMTARPRLAGNGRAFLTWEAPDTVRVYSLDGRSAKPGLLHAAGQKILCAALSPDGQTLVAGYGDGEWEAISSQGAKTHKSRDLCVPDAAEGAHGEPGIAQCMEFSKDGDILAIGTGRWCAAATWSTRDWQIKQSPFSSNHTVTDIVFASGRSEVMWVADFDGGCQRFNQMPYTNRVPPYPAIINQYGPVLDIALTEDGRWLAVAAPNKTARIYEAETLRPRAPDLSHDGEVTSVDWSPDGRLLLTGTAAGEVVVWSQVTGRRMWQWKEEAPVVQAAFALKGRRVVIARMDGMVLVREVYPGGNRPPEGIAGLLEKLSGFSVGSEGQLVTVPEE